MTPWRSTQAHVEHFPWVTPPALPAEGINGAFLDQSYRTASVSSMMPWLLLLTVAAVLIVARPGVSRVP